MSKYSDKLKDYRWRRRRARIIIRDGIKCQFCGCNHHLEVHHKRYIKGLDPWEYDNDDLITLCHYCHSRIHIGKIRKLQSDKTYISSYIKQSFNSLFE